MMERTKIASVVLVFLASLLNVHAEEINNLETIINQVNSANGGWTAGENFSPNVSINYLKGLTGTILEPHVSINEFYPHFLDEILDDDIPEEFDSSTRWPNCKPVITHVRDQGACGSCWAVAAASTFTDRLCIAGKISGSVEESSISAEEILSCCIFGGCHGGFLRIAWWHIKHRGTVTGGDYNSELGCKPYSLQPCGNPRRKCTEMEKTPKCPSHCTNDKYTIPIKKDKVYAKDYFKAVGEKTIQKAILTGGPVEASFLVYSDFPTYKSGVYRHITGERLGGHAVKIVGWGTENGTPYWTAVNSWNTDWGDNGFFKILRGENECQFESGVFFGVLN